MIQPAVALRVERPDELRDDRAQRDRHPGLTGGRCDDAHVLVVQRDAETRREVPREHAARLAVEDRVAGQAAGEYLDGRPGVNAVGLKEDDRLGDQLDDPAHYELVGRLDGLAGTGGPDVHDRPAHHLQQRPRRRDVGRLAAHHDRQHALDRALLAAGHRGVQDPEAACLPIGSQPGRRVRADGGEVDHQRARPGAREHPVLAAEHRGDVGRVGQHGGDHVGGGGRFGDAGRAAAPGGHQGVDLGRAAVVAGDVVAGLDQVAGHRAAHDAQPDEGDGGHDALPSRDLPALRPALLPSGPPPLPPWPAPPPPGPARRSRGSQARLSMVGTVGLYSSPTQPV